MWLKLKLTLQDRGGVKIQNADIFKSSALAWHFFYYKTDIYVCQIHENSIQKGRCELIHNTDEVTRNGKWTDSYIASSTQREHSKRFIQRVSFTQALVSTSKCFLSRSHTPMNTSGVTWHLVSCRGYLGMQIRAARDRTTKLQISGWSVWPSDPQPPQTHLWPGGC